MTPSLKPSDATAPRWMDHSKGTWVPASSRLQVPIPDCVAGSFLSVEFSVADGRSCDFDIMLEANDESAGAIRLYGPTRRATKVSTVVPITQTGTAYVTFDNIASWVQQKLVSYTLCVSDAEPEDAISYSTLAFGRNITRQPSHATTASQPSPPSPPKEVTVAAGKAEIVSCDVRRGQMLEVSCEVAQGSDVDFLMVLLPLGANGEVDEAAPHTTLYGPTHRSSRLHARMIMPHDGSVQLQFDASSSWFTSKLVRYSLDCRADETC